MNIYIYKQLHLYLFCLYLRSFFRSPLELIIFLNETRKIQVYLIPLSLNSSKPELLMQQLARTCLSLSLSPVYINTINIDFFAASGQSLLIYDDYSLPGQLLTLVRLQVIVHHSTNLTQYTSQRTTSNLPLDAFSAWLQLVKNGLTVMPEILPEHVGINKSKQQFSTTCCSSKELFNCLISFESMDFSSSRTSSNCKT